MVKELVLNEEEGNDGNKNSNEKIIVLVISDNLIDLN